MRKPRLGEQISDRILDTTLLLLVAIFIIYLLAQPPGASFSNEGFLEESTISTTCVPGSSDYPQGEVEVKPLNYSSNYAEMEKDLFDLVNKERVFEGVHKMEWSDDLAAVAREHSENLARENDLLTQPDLLCSYPLVHHAGFDFGLYHDDRMRNRNIDYYASSGENILLISTWKSKRTDDVESNNCENKTIGLSEPAEILQELETRKKLVNETPVVEWTFTYLSDDELKSLIIDGWMKSPSHRSNILDPDFNESGVGVAKTNEFFIITQVFIEKVDCGYSGSPCCPEQYCYRGYQCSEGICG